MTGDATLKIKILFFGKMRRNCDLNCRLKKFWTEFVILGEGCNIEYYKKSSNCVIVDVTE